MWGNVKVDKATNENPENMEIKDDPLEFKRKTGKIMMQNRKGETITHFLKRKKKQDTQKRSKNYQKEGPH